MMHPDLWAMLTAMARAFVIVMTVVYAFKLGQDVYQALIFLR